MRDRADYYGDASRVDQWRVHFSAMRRICRSWHGVGNNRDVTQGSIVNVSHCVRRGGMRSAATRRLTPSIDSAAGAQYIQLACPEGDVVLAPTTAREDSSPLPHST